MHIFKPHTNKKFVVLAKVFNSEFLTQKDLLAKCSIATLYLLRVRSSRTYLNHLELALMRVQSFSDTGQCFGEVALIQQVNHRTASVVADTHALLLIVKKELYDSTLKVDINMLFIMSFSCL